MKSALRFLPFPSEHITNEQKSWELSAPESIFKEV